jgi:hypothetical protein
MSRLSDVIKTRFQGLLDRYIPSRTKRMMFIASLSARLKDSSGLDATTRKRLNEVMAASHDEAAMQVPALLSRVIWDGRTVYQLCDDNVAEGTLDQTRSRRIASSVVEATPSWLRYAGKDDIEKDVRMLLDNRAAIGL